MKSQTKLYSGLFAIVLAAVIVLLSINNIGNSTNGLSIMQGVGIAYNDANSTGLGCAEIEQFSGKCFSDLSAIEMAKAQPVLEKRKALELKGVDWKQTGGGNRISSGHNDSAGGTNVTGQNDSGQLYPENSDERNSPPIINSFSPAEDVQIEKGGSVEFSFIATDTDDEELVAEWFIGSSKVGGGRSFTFNSINYNAGSLEVRLVVGDGRSYAEKKWSVSISPGV